VVPKKYSDLDQTVKVSVFDSKGKHFTPKSPEDGEVLGQAEFQLNDKAFKEPFDVKLPLKLKGKPVNDGKAVIMLKTPEEIKLDTGKVVPMEIIVGCRCVCVYVYVCMCIVHFYCDF